MTGEIWKRSKKVLAYALALMMVAGVVQTVVPVRADEDEVAAEAVALSTTDTAANTTTAAVAQTWKPTVSYNNGALEISLDESHIENGKTAYYEIWIDNHCDTGASEIKSAKKVNDKYCLNRCIWQDGTYKVNIWASDKRNFEEINNDKPAEPVSCTFEYQAPTNALVVKEVKWSEEIPGTVTWTLSGNNSDVLEYEVSLVKGDGNSNLDFMPSVMVSANDTSYNWSEKITDINDEYRVWVRAISKDIATKRSSDNALSGAYKPADTVSKVTPGIMEALWNTVSNNSSVNTTVSNNLVAGTNNTENIITALKTVSGNSGANNNTVAAAVVEELKKQQTGNGLKMAMQNDSKMVELVEIVEQMADGTAATTTVSTNDAEAKELFGVSTNDVQAKIKVVGAKLNATSGSTAALKLAKSDMRISEQDLGAMNANKAVSLDITLTGCGTAGDPLKIPVSITMPIPRGLNKSRLEILHLYGNNSGQEYIYPKDSGNGTITFIVSHFSTFVFIEKAGNTGSGGGGRQDTGVEALVTVAEAGATVKTKDITTLANGTMKALLKRGDVTLVMEYTYQGVDYVVTIPAGKAVDNDIPWYGPLYLAGMYGNGTGADKADKTADTVYVVKRGDTMSKIAKMSGMSLAELAKKNPQIKNLNRIRVGQSINR